MIFICLFDTSVAGMGYPFHTAIRYISFGTFLPILKSYSFPIWLMAAFIRFAAFLYINALMFGHLFKIKDFEYLDSLTRSDLFIDWNDSGNTN